MAVLAVAGVAALGACDGRLPDRGHDADTLTALIRAMPGVATAHSEFKNSFVQGQTFLWLFVETTPAVSADEVAMITDRYLRGLRTADYAGYDTELDIRQGPSRFAVDSSANPVANSEQIVKQARDWVALRAEFPGATIDARSTITHEPEPNAPGDTGHPFIATLDLADPSGYAALTAAVSNLGEKFPQLSSGIWFLHAGNAHPADINTVQRLPNAAELAVWNALNADQSIAHVDALSINAPDSAPVWFSEQTFSADPAISIALASRHLPIVATLPAPSFYTAGQLLQGRRNFEGHSTGPVAVTVGGCTPRNYQPAAGEQHLISSYEHCAQ